MKQKEIEILRKLKFHIDATIGMLNAILGDLNEQSGYIEGILSGESHKQKGEEK